MFPDLPSDRRLTNAEQLQLADLERRLTEDDPELIRRFRADPAAGEPVPRAILAVLAALACGLLVAAVLVGGAGGGAAVAASLALTGLVVVVPRLRRLRRRPTPPAATPPPPKKTATPEA
jgi:Flp pilus assembly protein TadB